jgi:hypothetical protein
MAPFVVAALLAAGGAWAAVHGARLVARAVVVAVAAWALAGGLLFGRPGCSSSALCSSPRPSYSSAIHLAKHSSWKLNVIVPAISAWCAIAS